MKLPEKPKRQYKSLAEFRGRRTFYQREFFDANPNKYPCFPCWGRSKIYDPNDPPCPVEGNKMRSMIKCPDCKGTGIMPAREFRAIYSEYLAKYRQQVEDWKYRVSVIKGAIAKLTEEEIRVLGL